MTTHELKCWTGYFDPIACGEKPFDIRLNDRKFKVGDLIVFKEYNEKTETYTNRDCIRRITYILHGVGPGAILPLVGVLRGYSILGLEMSHD